METAGIIYDNPAALVTMNAQPPYRIESFTGGVGTQGEDTELLSGRNFLSLVAPNEQNFVSTYLEKNINGSIKFRMSLDRSSEKEVYFIYKTGLSGIGSDVINGVIVSADDIQGSENADESDRFLKLLSACNIELVRASSDTELMMNICQICVETGGYKLAVIAFAANRDVQGISLSAFWAEEGLIPDSSHISGLSDSECMLKALRQKSIVIEDPAGNNGPESEGFPENLYCAAFPLFISDMNPGVFAVFKLKGQPFTKNETDLLNELSENISYGISYLHTLDVMRNIQNKLKTSESKFRRVVNELIDGISVTDEDGRLIVWNSAMEKITGRKSARMLGNYFWESEFDIYPKDFRDNRGLFFARKKLREYLDKGIPSSGDRYYEKEFVVNGSLRHIQGHFFSVSTDNGFLLVNLVRDITERKKAEKEIRKLNLELEKRVIERTSQLEEALDDLKMEVNIRQRMNDELRKARDESFKSLQKEKELVELKNRFISMISHEYRTPLTIILSSANLVERFIEGADFEKSTKYIKKVRKSVNNLIMLLESVLTISRSDAGHIKVKMKELDLNHFCLEAIDDVETMYENKYSIHMTNNSGLQTIRSDELLLKQVLINLLTNGIKYSGEKPKVKLTISDKEEYICFEVSDNGIGITDEDKDKLFEAFHRGINIETIPGTGLGLSIVKKSLNMLGGKIEVESRVNEGSVFRVILPANN